MNKENREFFARLRAEREEERERVMNPRPIRLHLPTGEKELVFPGGYEIHKDEENEHLYKLDKYGRLDLLVTYTPAFVLEYLVVKEPLPRVMAKIAFKKWDGWWIVTADIPNGFTPTFLFKIVNYGLRCHSGNIQRLGKFLTKFAELNKDKIPLTVVDDAPPVIVEKYDTEGGTDG